MTVKCTYIIKRENWSSGCTNHINTPCSIFMDSDERLPTLQHNKMDDSFHIISKALIQWLLAYCYSQLSGTLGLSNIGLGLYLDG